MIISSQKNFYLKNDFVALDKLPIGVYELMFNRDTNEHYLQYKSDSFDLPTKMYGDMGHLEDYLNKFDKGNGNLGILFSGYRGTSKSVSCKKLCNMSGKAVILINTPFTGPQFTAFIADPIFHDTIILLDEYEKTFDTHKGHDIDILRLMDGVYNTKLLFLLTVNQTRYINENLFNRPSRIRYRRHYQSIDMSVFNEMIDDKLDNAAFKPELLKCLEKIDTITIDILSSIIDDINFYDRSPKSVVKMFNLVRDEDVTYNLVCKSKLCDKDYIRKSINFGSNNDDALVSFYYYVPCTPDEDDDKLDEDYGFSSEHQYLSFDEFNKVNGRYVYENEKYIVYLDRVFKSSMIF